jgi:hypothetical protein
MDMDLSLLNNKNQTIKLRGKDVSFRLLTLNEHYNLKFDAEEIKDFTLKTRKDIPKITKMIKNFVYTLLEISEEEAAKVTYEEFESLYKFLDRLDMYHQGFTDEEIDELNKKAAFRAVNEAINKQAPDIQE